MQTEYSDNEQRYAVCEAIFSDKKNKWCSFAKIGSVGEISIYDDIGFGMSAKDFSRELKALGKIDELELRIGSNGGSISEGLAIYNMILNYKAKKTAYIDGIAASMASVIAMAADEVSIADNAAFMIHNPWTMADGNSADLRKTADVLDKWKDALVKSYMRKCKLSYEDIAAMMDEETWLNADDCIQLGFADKKHNILKIAACSTIPKNFRNVPTELLTIANKGKKMMSDLKEMVVAFGREFALDMQIAGKTMDEARALYCEKQKQDIDAMGLELAEAHAALEAKDVEIGQLKAEIDNLKSKPAAVAYGEAPANVEAKELTYMDKVEEYQKTGMSRKDAILSTVKNHPELHEKYIANANKR